MNANLLSANPKDRLVLEPSIQNRIADCKSKLAKYEIFRLQNSDALFPADAVNRLRQQLAHATSPKEAQALLDRISALSNPGAAEVAAITRSLAHREFAPAQEAIAGLLVEARRLVADYLDEAESIEAEFFGKFGLPHEATSLSKRYSATLAQLDQRLNDWQNRENSNQTATILPNANSTPLFWFGVSLMD